MQIGMIKILLFNDSRKVGFGLWTFVVTTVLMVLGKFDVQNWMTCFWCASILIGGGTLGDKMIEAKKGVSDAKPA